MADAIRLYFYAQALDVVMGWIAVGILFTFVALFGRWIAKNWKDLFDF